jgi:hypothetical protein
VEEEAERAKENLHLHFTTLEAALCRTLREREAQLAAEINNSADYRCRTLLQLRNEVRESTPSPRTSWTHALTDG